MKFSMFDREFIIKKEIIVIISSLLFVIILAVGYLVSQNNNEEIIIDKSIDHNKNSDESISVTNKTYFNNELEENTYKAAEIKVYIVGCVNNPGIVTLKKGQLLNDAIVLAGGVTKDADIENINLVYELKENVMIRIKSKELKNEVIKNFSNNTVPNNNVPLNNSIPKNTGIEIIKDSANAVLNQSSSNESLNKDNSSKIININTATKEELDTLPGIGAITAEKIIAQREKNSRFNAKEEIMDVPGIGKSKYESIKDLITAE